MTPNGFVDRVSKRLVDLGVDQSAESSVVVGLSGGVDSTVLLYVCSRLRYKLDAVHVNYGLRGEASAGDETFCRQLCQDLGVTLQVYSPNEPEFRAQGQSLQESARDYRYLVFGEVSTALNADCVLLGHHADDNAETLLLNIFRGTGLKGLGGIPPIRRLDRLPNVRIARPLLGFRRSEIESFARGAGLTWREDASNSDAAYGRGFIRTHLVPRIAEGFGDAAFGNISRTASHVREFQEASHDPLVEAVFHGVATGASRLSVPMMLNLEPIWQDQIIVEALRRWAPTGSADRHAVASVRALLKSQTGRQVTIGDCTVIRDRDELVFNSTSRHKHEVSESLSLVVNGLVKNDRYCILSNSLKQSPPTFVAPQHHVAYVDARAFPVTVRKWRDGDKMQLSGSSKTKKVSDILTDAKVSSADRSRRWVVESSDGILWVPGAARSDIHKIGPETSEVVLLTYIEEK